MRVVPALVLAALTLWGCGEDNDPTRPNDFVPLTAITIQSQYPQIANGTTNQFTAIGDFSGMFTRDITNQVIWDDPSGMVQISNAAESRGLARAEVIGDTTVTATLGEVVGTLPFKVTDATISTIVVEPTNPSLAKGLTLGFSARGIFSDQTEQDISTVVTWSSNLPSIATITSTGTATAVDLGIATVSAAFGEATGSTALTVTAAILQSISLESATTHLVPNENLQMKATGQLSDGTSEDITSNVTWTSSAPTVASISAGGLVVATQAGTTTIRASQGDFAAEVGLNVVQLQSIDISTVDDVATEVTVGGTLQLRATGNYTEGVTRDLTTQVEWKSQGTNFATVGNVPGSKGLVTGIAATPNVEITAEKDNVINSLSLVVR